MVKTAVKDKKCPKCGDAGTVEDLFGYRKINGKQVAQSWCRGCRSSGKPKTPAVVKTAETVHLGAWFSYNAKMVCVTLECCTDPALAAKRGGLALTYEDLEKEIEAARAVRHFEMMDFLIDLRSYSLPTGSCRQGGGTLPSLDMAKRFIALKMYHEPKAPAKVKAPKAKPVLHVPAVPGDRDACKALYIKYFPNDTSNNVRAWKYMAEKLRKKTGWQFDDLAKRKMGMVK